MSFPRPTSRAPRITLAMAPAAEFAAGEKKISYDGCAGVMGEKRFGKPFLESIAEG